jgi:rhamnose transport system ATP-binding protein
MENNPQPILEMRGISKRFDATQALDSVSLSLFPGEVHALLGENGAGKSTLIKIMTGIYREDTGQMLLNGQPITIDSSAGAQLHGIAAIYQEPMVFPDLNVAENIFISHARRGSFVNWRRMYREAEEILSKLGVRMDVRSQSRGLTLAAQQTVEIAKALSLDARVLIMDEPTASLSAHEVEQLFKLENCRPCDGLPRRKVDFVRADSGSHQRKSHSGHGGARTWRVFCEGQQPSG